MKSAAEQLWKLEWNEMTGEVIRSAAEEIQTSVSEEKAGRNLWRQWMEEMGLSKDPAMQKLLQMTVFYKTMPEFMNAISLGVESDLRRCGTKKYTGRCCDHYDAARLKGAGIPGGIYLWCGSGLDSSGKAKNIPLI